MASELLLETPVTTALTILVDDEDFAFLSQWRWIPTGGGYAGRGRRKDVPYQAFCNERNPHGEPEYGSRMHRFLVGDPPGLDVDHINGDHFDNRRSNLRACTHSENCHNMPVHRGATGRFITYREIVSHFKRQDFIIRRCIWAGVIPCIQLGGGEFIFRADGQAFIDSYPDSACGLHETCFQSIEEDRKAVKARRDWVIPEESLAGAVIRQRGRPRTKETER